MGYASICHVPFAVRKQLVELGAVTARMSVIRQSYQAGTSPFTDLVYFFDAQGNEVGYWSILNDVCGTPPTVFKPNYRVWDPDLLSRMTSCHIGVYPEPTEEPRGQEEKDRRSGD